MYLGVGGAGIVNVSPHVQLTVFKRYVGYKSDCNGETEAQSNKRLRGYCCGVIVFF